jgi:hypothetical protein
LYFQVAICSTPLAGALPCRGLSPSCPWARTCAGWLLTLLVLCCLQGCHPDAAVFNSLMEVLWQSGVLLAQVRALQLWSLANKNGQFRWAMWGRGEGSQC